jgi:23S rRNA pseudouridine2605 synthase
MVNVRLQKFLAEAGIASRRAAEAIILEGRVKVNGRVVTELGTKVAESDKVSVDGKSVRAKRKLHIALHKPQGYLCSKSEPGGWRLAGDLLPKEWSELYPVGRLDLESEGLIFFTNDGDFCLRMTHPRYGVKKIYIAMVDGRLKQADLAPLLKGVQSDGDILRAEKARLLDATNSRSVVELVLGEGKNREVRRMFESIGRVVTRLVRTQIGRTKLGELPAGKWRALTAAEVKSLLSSP